MAQIPLLHEWTKLWIAYSLLWHGNYCAVGLDRRYFTAGGNGSDITSIAGGYEAGRPNFQFFI